MKKDEVKVGGTYVAKVSDRLVTVRIDSTHSGGGWNATNTATGKRIRIKSAQRLRGVAGGKAGDRRPEAGGQRPEAGDVRPEAPDRTNKDVPQAGTSSLQPKASSLKLGALEAAAQVLAKAEKPMGAKDLIAAMAEQHLWTSPTGKTPHATLSAAIHREIATKGEAARFKKADRGLFVFNKEAT